MGFIEVIIHLIHHHLECHYQEFYPKNFHYVQN
jgi:hypothetical protein